MATRELARRAWPDASTGSLLAVPVGSLEQHGPHLPLATDTVLASEVVNRFADGYPGAIAAPPIAYGASGEHEGFAGTISIGRHALELLLVELGRSASRTYDRIVLVNGHGGNAEPLERACRTLAGEGRSVLGWHLHPGDDRQQGDAHAGRTETAMMLAVAPGDVDESAAEAGNTAPLSELLPAIRRSSVRAASGNGVLGDPTGASPAEGAELLARLAEELRSAVEDWLR